MQMAAIRWTIQRKPRVAAIWLYDAQIHTSVSNLFYFWNYSLKNKPHLIVSSLNQILNITIYSQGHEALFSLFGVLG